MKTKDAKNPDMRETAAPNGASLFPPSHHEVCPTPFNQDLSKGGVKFDIGKPRYDLIAPEFLHGLAEILTFGTAKYTDRNWEQGMEWGRPFGALMRHMWAWWNGEAVDAETGKSHLHHAACCLMFLTAYEARQIGKDNRRGELDVQRIARAEPHDMTRTVSFTMPTQSAYGHIARNTMPVEQEEQCDLFDEQQQNVFAHMVQQLDTNDGTAASAFQNRQLLSHYRVLGKRKIYLAGPMRNIAHFNFPAFHEFAKRLRGIGFVVFNPAENDINTNGSADFVVSNTTGCLDEATEKGFDLRKALAEDAKFICEEADILALMPGWERSKGAQAERALAVALGIDVIELNGEYPYFVA